MAQEKYGRYEIRREWGRGGMSTVYLAHDPRFDREVALKVLPPGFLQDPSFRDRFDREAKIIAQLEHAAIVPVYDYGEDHGRPYLVMRLMTGGTLRDRIDRGPLQPPEVVAISRRICAALEKAHSRGIIHRDIKPPNILFDEEGAAYLADFGIARLAEGTQTVTAMGTPQYIAPEQVFGEPLDARTDIYQMGVVLFEMLTGRPPFEADNSAALIYKHCHEPVPSARGVNPALTPVADAVIERAMAKEKDGRYATAAQLADAIRRIRAKEPARRPPAGEPAPPPVVEEVPFPQTEPWVPPEVARQLWEEGAEPAPAAPPSEDLAIPQTEPWVPLEVIRPAEEPGPEPEPAPTGPPAAELEPEPPVRRVGPVLFLRRSPRIFPEVPVGRVGIPAPPDPPVKPSPSLRTYLTERKKHERALAKRQEDYRQLLGEARQKLEQIERQYVEALCGIDPAPADCLKRAEGTDSRLWERVPQQADFLALRVGLGQRPFPVEVGLPRVDAKRDPDPLLEEALELGRSFAHLDRVPVLYALASCGGGALVGPRTLTLNLVRGLVLQIATHHSPDEVKIVAVFPPNEDPEWDWMRWLPHVWTDDRRGRFLACYQDAAGELLAGLRDLLQARRQALDESGAEGEIPLPRFALLLADPTLVQGEPMVPWLLQQGARLGAYPLFLAEGADSLPKGRLVVAETGPAGARLVLPGRPDPVAFSPDDTPLEMAERFARATAPIRPEVPAAPPGVPERVTLLEVLGVDRVEEMDVLSRWRQSRPGETLAVPLGRKAGAESVGLDIHENGHGPHGLVAGAAGSGKKDSLQSLMAALALHHHPHELTFFLLEPGKGGLAGPFQGLPHLLGAVSGREAGGALGALKAESQRRRESLVQFGAEDLAQYLEMARQEGGPPPMPHLVVIVSDLDEVLNGTPDVVDELVDLARTGGEVGLHLILTTQDPVGAINDTLRDMARFRLCLRVERPAASRVVLGMREAADLTRPGQAILQVGDREVEEELQVAWGGAPCQRGGFAASDPHEVLEVALDGSRQSLRLSTEPLRIETAVTQLEALLVHIRQVAQREGIQPLPGLPL